MYGVGSQSNRMCSHYQTCKSHHICFLVRTLPVWSCLQYLSRPHQHPVARVAYISQRAPTRSDPPPPPPSRLRRFLSRPLVWRFATWRCLSPSSTTVTTTSSNGCGTSAAPASTRRAAEVDPCRAASWPLPPPILSCSRFFSSSSSYFVSSLPSPSHSL